MKLAKSSWYDVMFMNSESFKKWGKAPTSGTLLRSLIILRLVAQLPIKKTAWQELTWNRGLLPFLQAGSNVAESKGPLEGLSTASQVRWHKELIHKSWSPKDPHEVSLSTLLETEEVFTLQPFQNDGAPERCGVCMRKSASRPGSLCAFYFKCWAAFWYGNGRGYNSAHSQGFV